MSWGDTYNRHKAKGMDPNDAALRADQAENRKAKPTDEGHAVAAVIAFYPGQREPRLLSWNQMPDGEHKLYAYPAPQPNLRVRRPKLPPIGNELYEHYPAMSAQTHADLVKDYAREAVRAALATEGCADGN